MSRTNLTDGSTQTAVLSAAIEVFTRRGYEKTRVEDLLEGAGISRRTFYKYFGGKADVLTALYKHVTGELIVDIVEAAGASDDPLAGLRVALDKYLNFHIENHDLVRILVEEATRSESPLWPLRNGFRSALVHMIQRVVTTATGRSLDPLVFYAVVSGLEGLSLELVVDACPTEADVARTRWVILGLLEAVIRSHDAFPDSPPC